MIKVLKYLFSTRSIPIVICTSLMLFFLGIYFLFAFKSNVLVTQLKNETNFLIELEKSYTEENISALDELIISEIGFVESSIKRISSDQARDLMIKDLGEEFLEISEENPFFEVIQFKLESNELDTEDLITKYRALPYVHNMYAEYSYVEDIARNVKYYSRAALIVGLFFTGLAFLLIFNAIKLSLVESKSSFYTLKLLGADWNFIKKPFLQRAFYSGLTSSIVAIVIILGSIFSLRYSYEIFKELVGVTDIFLIIAIMVLIGLLVNLISTNYILNKFLNMKEEDLY